MQCPMGGAGDEKSECFDGQEQCVSCAHNWRMLVGDEELKASAMTRTGAASLSRDGDLTSLRAMVVCNGDPSLASSDGGATGCLAR